MPQHGPLSALWAGPAEQQHLGSQDHIRRHKRSGVVWKNGWEQDRTEGRPAEVLIGGLLVGGHQVHKLQPSTLMLRPQQGAAVCVDAAHPLQRLEEGLPYLASLLAPKNSREAASSTRGMVVCASTHSRHIQAPLSETAAARRECRSIHCLAVLLRSKALSLDPHQIRKSAYMCFSH